MNYKISINIPDAYRLKIEESNEFENSIFNTVYSAAKENLIEIVNFSSNEDNLKNEAILSNNFNNVICFVGERGQGKSSSMISFLKALVNKNKDDPFFIEEEMFKTRFTTIELVDPSLFKGDETLFEIILAKMFSSFKNSLENDKQSKITDDERRELVSLFQKVFENLKYINNRKGIYEEDSLDALIKLSTSSNLKVSFENLVAKYLKVVPDNKTKYLVIAIDDFDLKTEGVHSMLEDIRRFLISSKIVLLVACKIEQLRESIEANIYSEYLRQTNNNAVILNNIVDNSEIKNKAIKYIDKLIPQSRRIKLPEVSRLDLKSILTQENNSDFTPDTLILQVIYERLRLFIKKESYQKAIFLKSTLRTLISLLFNLKRIESIDKKNSEKNLQIITEFQDYVKYFIQDFIEIEEINFIIDSPEDLLNFRIINSLSHRFKKNVEIELIQYRSYHLIKNGDVYATFYNIECNILDGNENFAWFQSIRLLYLIKQLTFNISHQKNYTSETFNLGGLINSNLVDEKRRFPKDSNGRKDREFFNFIENRKKADDSYLENEINDSTFNKIRNLDIESKAILASFTYNLGIIEKDYRKDNTNIFDRKLGLGSRIITSLHFSIFSFFTAPYVLGYKLKENFELTDDDLKNNLPINSIYEKWKTSDFYYLFNNVDFVLDFYNEFVDSYHVLSKDSELKVSEKSYYEILKIMFDKGLEMTFNNLNKKYPSLELSISKYHDAFILAKLFLTNEYPELTTIINHLYETQFVESKRMYAIIEPKQISEINAVKNINEIKQLIKYFEDYLIRRIVTSNLDKKLKKVDSSLEKVIRNNYLKSINPFSSPIAIKNREKLISELKALIEKAENNG